VTSPFLQDEEYDLPSAEALMAGTLALLTGYAHAPPACANRRLMAKKLVSNLFYLAAHPQVSPSMRVMLGNLRTRWQLELDKDGPTLPPSAPRQLWHSTPEALQ